ncbi:MAG: hypothetical protein E6Q97_07630, partial [Desulfurellales bacterium]
NQFGLPVVEWTDGSETKAPQPSFDKIALKTYLDLKSITDEQRSAIELTQKFRKTSILVGMFLEPYIEKHVGGYLHPTYNQIIRTGRTSCSEPNFQQLDKRAKTYILPPLGRSFWSFDYSQIEFRLLVHVTDDASAIKAYGENPFTDFHSLVAEWCGIPRRPAKNVNFAIGYGGGEKKVVSMLSAEPVLTNSLLDSVDKMIADGKLDIKKRDMVFRQLCQKKGKEVYDTYHRTFPGIRIMTRKAEMLTKKRGYVKNGYGRRRHLPRRMAYKGLNSSVQGWAMDIMKDRMTAISPRFNPKAKELGIRIHAVVHDELLMSVPTNDEQNPVVIKFVQDTLESPSVKLKIPIRTVGGFSSLNWREADSELHPLQRVQ